MVTREEIREGLKSFFKLCADCGRMTFDCGCPECIEDRDIFIRALCEHLHSQGVVLKVEDWLPTHSGMVCTVDPLIETDAQMPAKEQ